MASDRRYAGHIGHHYFATQPDIIQSTVDKDLDPLEAAIGDLMMALVQEDTAQDNDG